MADTSLDQAQMVCLATQASPHLKEDSHHLSQTFSCSLMTTPLPFQIGKVNSELPQTFKKYRKFYIITMSYSVSLGITLHPLVSTPQTLVSCASSPLPPKSLSQTWRGEHFNTHGFGGEQWVQDQRGAERGARSGMPS